MIQKIKSIKIIIEKLRYVLTGKQKLVGLILIFLTLLNSVLQTVSVAIVSPLVSIMSNGDAFMQGRIATVLSTFLGDCDLKSYFIAVCVLAIIIYLVKEVFCVFYMWFSTKYTLRIERELSNRVFASYMNRDYDFFLNYNTAKLLRDIREDTSGVNNLIRCFINLGVEFVTLVFILLYILVSFWQIALCMAVLSAICALLSFKYFKNMMKQSGAEARIQHANTQKITLEALEGIKEVQVMRKQRYFIKAFDEQIVKHQKPREREIIATVMPTYVIEGIFVIGMMIYLIITALVNENFGMLLPVLASTMVGAVRLLPSLGRISSAMNYIPFYMPALSSVYDNVKLIDENEATIRKVEENSNNGKCAVLTDSLELKDICWNYRDSDKVVLNDLNLSVKKGQSVGIIGQSGAGKSTLADIILGLHSPQKGKVLLDGIDIASMPENYSDLIGYVAQSVYLFDGTVKENVAFGVKDEEIDEELVWESLRQAQLESFVKSMKDGANTVIGEKGVKLSGGQRQRLAIARALYRKPQILVLDEATSALDIETEKTLMREIESLYGKITLIIIAHRLSTVEKCDVIYEIADGKANIVDWNSIR